MSVRDRQAPSPPPSAEPTRRVVGEGWNTAAPAPAFTGCPRCLDTGWAFMPHSDEARERCDCTAAHAIKGPTETLLYHPQMKPLPFDVSLLWGGLTIRRH